MDPAQIPGLGRLTIRDGDPEWPDSSLVVADVVTADVPILVTCEGIGRTVPVGGEEANLQPGDWAFMEAATSPSALTTTILIDSSTYLSPPLIRRIGGVRLRLRADRESRVSVLDSDGRAQLPEGAMRKRDWRLQGYVHASEAELEVIPGRYPVRAARGIETASRTQGWSTALRLGDLALGDLRDSQSETRVLRHRPRFGGPHRGLGHPVTKS